MKSSESVADVFLMALKSMPKEQKDAVLVRIVSDKEFRQDIQDLWIIENRKDEPIRPFREYLTNSCYAR